MIKKLRIKGFQSHKDTEIEFHPGLNVITGLSDSGKSGIVRTFFLALENKPNGWDYKSWFKDCDETVVTVEFDDGVLERRRKGTSNTYTVNEHVLEGVGKGGVPEAVRKLTRMDTYNIIKQFDPYFMLQNTPGDVASMLNEVADLEIIDHTIDNVNDIVSTSKTALERTKKDIQNYEQELNKLSWLEEAGPLLDLFENELDALRELETKEALVSDSLLKLNQTTDAIAKTDAVLAMESYYQELSEMIRQIAVDTTDINMLNDIILRYEKADLEIQEASSWESATPLYNEFRDTLQEIKALDTQISSISTAINSFYSQVRMILEEEQKITTIKTQLIEQLLLSKVCPFCNSPITDESLTHCLEHL